MSQADAPDALASQLTMGLPYEIGRWAKPIAAAARNSAPPAEGARKWAWVLAAIIKRESNGGKALTPPGPAGTGDYGHGRGLMQIDDRFHEFARTGAWQDPGANIAYGSQLLRAFYDQADGDLARAVAAYNAGPKAIHADDPDSVTTGRNYSSDVLARAAGWAPEEVSFA